MGAESRCAGLLRRRNQLNRGSGELTASGHPYGGEQFLGGALLRQEDLAAARDALEAALARDPTSVLALTMLARCYERLGDDERARELYARATSRTGGELGA